jgi:hypothetical protein
MCILQSKQGGCIKRLWTKNNPSLSLDWGNNRVNRVLPENVFDT